MVTIDTPKTPPEESFGGGTAAGESSRQALVPPPPRYVERDPGSPVTPATPATPGSGAEDWNEIIKQLESQIQSYRNNTTDPDLKDALKQQIEESMNRVISHHPDPGVQSAWRRKALEFKAAEEGGGNLAHEFWNALLTLIAAPFIISGTILIFSGQIVKGIGSGFMRGKLGERQEEETGRPGSN